MSTVGDLIVISDLHAGCRMALCPPLGVTLDDGGTYIPSAFQMKLWDYWQSFWSEWVPRVTRGRPFAIALNGDALDGVHHGSISQISQNLSDQQRIAEALLKPVVEAAEGRYYHLRGTEAHSGPSAEKEEALARALEAIPNAEGQHARWDLWIEIGKALVHLMHHVGTTGSSHFETTAPHRELTEMFVEAAKWRERPPDFVVRSHRHRYVETRIPIANYFAVVCVTPGWQGKTPYAWKIAGARITTPQFGGICIRQGDEEAYLRQRVWSIARSKTEIPA